MTDRLNPHPPSVGTDFKNARCPWAWRTALGDFFSSWRCEVLGIVTLDGRHAWHCVQLRASARHRRGTALQCAHSPRCAECAHVIGIFWRSPQRSGSCTQWESGSVAGAAVRRSMNSHHQERAPMSRRYALESHSHAHHSHGSSRLDLKPCCECSC